MITTTVTIKVIIMSAIPVSLFPATVFPVIASEIAPGLLMPVSVVAVVLYVISVPHVRFRLVYHNFVSRIEINVSVESGKPFAKFPSVSMRIDKHAIGNRIIDSQFGKKIVLGIIVRCRTPLGLKIEIDIDPNLCVKCRKTG
jgi:hypothetical protein